jgi:hypothetical protein
MWIGNVFFTNTLSDLMQVTHTSCFEKSAIKTIYIMQQKQIKSNTHVHLYSTFLLQRSRQAPGTEFSTKALGLVELVE